MIKITKPGKTIQYKFVCDKCGCEYTADLADVRKLYCGAQEWADCKCPNCDTMNFGAEIKYEGEFEKQ